MSDFCNLMKTFSDFQLLLKNQKLNNFEFMRDINRNKDNIINLYPDVDQRVMETSDSQEFEKVLLSEIQEDDFPTTQGEDKNNDKELETQDFGADFMALRSLSDRR